MAANDPITQEEMYELFGEFMPIEAVQLMSDAQDHVTVGELRAKLREIAVNRRMVYRDEAGNLFSVHNHQMIHHSE